MGWLRTCGGFFADGGFSGLSFVMLQMRKSCDDTHEACPPGGISLLGPEPLATSLSLVRTDPSESRGVHSAGSQWPH